MAVKAKSGEFFQVTVDMGNVEDSLKAILDRASLFANLNWRIGAYAYYAIFLEMGTVKMPPRPHVVPVVLQHAKQIADSLAGDIGGFLPDLKKLCNVNALNAAFMRATKPAVATLKKHPQTPEATGFHKSQIRARTDFEPDFPVYPGEKERDYRGSLSGEGRTWGGN